MPLELMRFFTGFGVRKFNYNKVKGQDWVDSVLYKMEVTPLAENWKGKLGLALTSATGMPKDIVCR